MQLWSNNGLLRTWKTVGGHRRIARTSVDDILAKNHSISHVDVQHLKNPSESEQQESLSIVIVEDDKAQVRLYKKQLAKLNFKTSITVAEDAYIGLMKIGANLPDIIISDLRMPYINGFKMIDSLKSLPELDNTLKIVVTVLTAEEVNIRGGLPEDVHLFTKPVAFEHLAQLINKKAKSLMQTNSQQSKIS